jgi:hypothetical protein
MMQEETDLLSPESTRYQSCYAPDQMQHITWLPERCLQSLDFL